MVQKLYLNKRAENRARQTLESDINDSIVEIDDVKCGRTDNDNKIVTLSDGSVIAATPYVMEKVDSIL